MGSITDVAFSPDGTQLAVASSIGIWLYDAQTLHETTLLTGLTWVNSVVFSPDGGTLAGGSADGTIRLWDAATGESRRTLKGHASDVRSVAFNADGTTLVSGGGWEDNTVRLWNTGTGELRKSLTGMSLTFIALQSAATAR